MIGPVQFLRDLTEAIRRDFLRWDEFDKTARVASHSNLGVIELMPVADRTRYAFKYVNGHPANTCHALPTVMAFGALADINTGYPLLISELTLTTAFRTAATSALAALALARKDARRMALIGNGAQSEFQALAFHHLLGIEEIRAYDIDANATHKLIANLAREAPRLRVLPVRGIRQAVEGADIVTTVTADKTRATIITLDMIEPGMHLNAVGGDCPGKTELAPDVLAAGSVFVEYEPQTRIEGDVQLMPDTFPVVELWRVLCGDHPGRQDATEVTIFDSVGFAIEDFSALNYLLDSAERYDIGVCVAMTPPPVAPKDLFRFAATADADRIA